MNIPRPVTGTALRRAVISSKRKQKEVAESMGITYARLWQLYRVKKIEQRIVECAVAAGLIIEGVNNELVPATKLLSLLHQTQIELQKSRAESDRLRMRNEALEKKLRNLKKTKS